MRSRRSAIWITTLLFGAVSVCLAAQPGIWLDVPFVKQQTNGCGAACMSMVMQYWAKRNGEALPRSADARQIQRELYNPQAKGIYSADMERYFRGHGFRVFAFSANWDDLQQHLSKGRPLIVCLADGGSDDPLHYVVVVGLDQQQGVILVNDPAQRKLLKMDSANFEKRWNTMHNWTLLAVPEQGR